MLLEKLCSKKTLESRDSVHMVAASKVSMLKPDGYANNEGNEILEEHWKKASYEGAPRNPRKTGIRENTRRVMPVETTTSNALISCDGLSDYDWSDQAEEGPPNFALMAYSSTSSNSKVSTDSNCLESIQARLLVYKKNESVYEEDIKLLKRNFMPPKPDLSFFGLEEFVNEPIVSESAVKKPVVETSKAKASADKTKAVKKNNGAPIIKDWESDSEE
ncbi:hypothetical protein Tco_0320820 [Tanacetum coccineum]